MLCVIEYHRLFASHHGHRPQRKTSKSREVRCVALVNKIIGAIYASFARCNIIKTMLRNGLYTSIFIESRLERHKMHSVVYQIAILILYRWKGRTVTMLSAIDQ